jgi:ribulose-bisphosphate carboxylase large chain
LSKFARLAGASGIHTGTAGVGKMAGTPEEDVTAANNILKMLSGGHHFEQSWTRIDEKDKDLADLIKRDVAHHVNLDGEEWRGIKKCCPIISGGLNPTLLKPFIDIMGNVDFITTMGAGCHAHPKGTQSGAAALVQSCEAYIKGVDIKEYAKTHKELAQAIEFFTKNKTKIQKVESAEKN